MNKKIPCLFCALVIVLITIPVLYAEDAESLRIKKHYEDTFKLVVEYIVLPEGKKIEDIGISKVEFQIRDADYKERYLLTFITPEFERAFVDILKKINIPCDTLSHDDLQIMVFHNDFIFSIRKIL